MRFPSLQELFDLMISRGTGPAAEAIAGIPDDAATVPMSIRVKPRVKAWYESQADACGAGSASAMSSMVLEGIMKATINPKGEADDPTSVARRQIAEGRARFFHLFNIHGFTPAMMAEAVKPHGISLADLMDDARLLPLLTNEVLADHAKRFNASLKWLQGLHDRPVPTPSPEFHKRPQWICKRIIDILLEGEVSLTAIFVREKDHNFEGAFAKERQRVGDIAVVLRHGRSIAGLPYHRYEPWSHLPWDYDQVRLAVKPLLLWLERLRKVSNYRVAVEGVEVEKDTMLALYHGHMHPAEALDRKDWRRTSRWDPDDYVAEAVTRFKNGSTQPNSSAKEAHERASAIDYYSYANLDNEIRRLPYFRAKLLEKPVGEEWD